MKSSVFEMLSLWDSKGFSPTLKKLVPPLKLWRHAGGGQVKILRLVFSDIENIGCRIS